MKYKVIFEIEFSFEIEPDDGEPWTETELFQLSEDTISETGILSPNWNTDNIKSWGINMIPLTIKTATEGEK